MSVPTEQPPSARQILHLLSAVAAEQQQGQQRIQEAELTMAVEMVVHEFASSVGLMKKEEDDHQEGEGVDGEKRRRREREGLTGEERVSEAISLVKELFMHTPDSLVRPGHRYQLPSSGSSSSERKKNEKRSVGVVSSLFSEDYWMDESKVPILALLVNGLKEMVCYAKLPGAISTASTTSTGTATCGLYSTSSGLHPRQTTTRRQDMTYDMRIDACAALTCVLRRIGHENLLRIFPGFASALLQQTAIDMQNSVKNGLPPRKVVCAELELVEVSMLLCFQVPVAPTSSRLSSYQEKTFNPWLEKALPKMVPLFLPMLVNNYQPKHIDLEKLLSVEVDSDASSGEETLSSKLQRQLLTISTSSSRANWEQWHENESGGTGVSSTLALSIRETLQELCVKLLLRCSDAFGFGGNFSSEELIAESSSSGIATSDSHSASPVLQRSLLDSFVGLLAPSEVLAEHRRRDYQDAVTEKNLSKAAEKKEKKRKKTKKKERANDEGEEAADVSAVGGAAATNASWYWALLTLDAEAALSHHDDMKEFEEKEDKNSKDVSGREPTSLTPSSSSCKVLLQQLLWSRVEELTSTSSGLEDSSVAAAARVALLPRYYTVLSILHDCDDEEINGKHGGGEGRQDQSSTVFKAKFLEKAQVFTDTRKRATTIIGAGIPIATWLADSILELNITALSSSSAADRQRQQHQQEADSVQRKTEDRFYVDLVRALEQQGAVGGGEEKGRSHSSSSLEAWYSLTVSSPLASSSTDLCRVLEYLRLCGSLITTDPTAAFGESTRVNFNLRDSGEEDTQDSIWLLLARQLFASSTPSSSSLEGDHDRRSSGGGDSSPLSSGLIQLLADWDEYELHKAASFCGHFIVTSVVASQLHVKQKIAREKYLKRRKKNKDGKREEGAAGLAVITEEGAEKYEEQESVARAAEKVMKEFLWSTAAFEDGLCRLIGLGSRTNHEELDGSTEKKSLSHLWLLEADSDVASLEHISFRVKLVKTSLAVSIGWIGLFLRDAVAGLAPPPPESRTRVQEDSAGKNTSTSLLSKLDELQIKYGRNSYQKFMHCLLFPLLQKCSSVQDPGVASLAQFVLSTCCSLPLDQYQYAASSSTIPRGGGSSLSSSLAFGHLLTAYSDYILEAVTWQWKYGSAAGSAAATGGVMRAANYTNTVAANVVLKNYFTALHSSVTGAIRQAIVIKKSLVDSPAARGVACEERNEDLLDIEGGDDNHHDRTMLFQQQLHLIGALIDRATNSFCTHVKAVLEEFFDDFMMKQTDNFLNHILSAVERKTSGSTSSAATASILSLQLLEDATRTLPTTGDGDRTGTLQERRTFLLSQWLMVLQRQVLIVQGLKLLDEACKFTSAAQLYMNTLLQPPQQEDNTGSEDSSGSPSPGDSKSVDLQKGNHLVDVETDEEGLHYTKVEPAAMLLLKELAVKVGHTAKKLYEQMVSLETNASVESGSGSSGEGRDSSSSDSIGGKIALVRKKIRENAEMGSKLSASIALSCFKSIEEPNLEVVTKDEEENNNNMNQEESNPGEIKVEEEKQHQQKVLEKKRRARVVLPITIPQKRLTLVYQQYMSLISALSPTKVRGGDGSSYSNNQFSRTGFGQNVEEARLFCIEYLELSQTFRNDYIRWVKEEEEEGDCRSINRKRNLGRKRLPKLEFASKTHAGTNSFISLLGYLSTAAKPFLSHRMEEDLLPILLTRYVALYQEHGLFVRGWTTRRTSSSPSSSSSATTTTIPLEGSIEADSDYNSIRLSAQEKHFTKALLGDFLQSGVLSATGGDEHTRKRHPEYCAKIKEKCRFVLSPRDFGSITW